MEFDPRNNVIKLCVQGMGLKDEGKPDEARKAGQLGRENY